MALFRTHLLPSSWSIRWVIWSVCDQMEPSGPGVPEEVPGTVSCNGVGDSRRHNCRAVLPEYVLENQHDRNDGNSVPRVRRGP